ncbi:MAG: cytochrome c-type biogenesis CcmF C-terminal domain-containing protein, partial [Acidimicrobiales bacterium]
TGGMVVHLGVVIMAVAITAASSYTHRTELALARGRPAYFDGHSFVFDGFQRVVSASRSATGAVVRVDGSSLQRPSVTQFAGANSQVVGTPAIDSAFSGDVYLTLDAIGGTGPATGATAFPNLPNGSVAVGVIVEPLIGWLWAGGLVIGFGGLLALVPQGRRRVNRGSWRSGTSRAAGSAEFEPADGTDSPPLRGPGVSQRQPVGAGPS